MGMRSTEAILASDCPFRGSDRQLFSKKKHPDFRERPFYSLISDLASFTCPEKTTFSNDTAADIGKDGLGHRVREKNPCFPDRVLRRRIEGISSDGSLDRGDREESGGLDHENLFMARARTGNIFCSCRLRPEKFRTMVSGPEIFWPHDFDQVIG
jgi:hypothetical protein